MNKKSKSQQCGGGEKNGLAAGAAPVVLAAPPAEDAMLVDEQDVLAETSGASTGVAANLFRKKACPPQPAKKKLVIKMHKGIISLSLAPSLSHIPHTMTLRQN
jgi:hypothetical protein